jgi:hypothetical protein
MAPWDRVSPVGRALEVCLQAMAAEAPLETALEPYPALAAELRPLLAAAQTLQALGAPAAELAEAQEISGARLEAALALVQGFGAPPATRRARPFGRRLGLIVALGLLLWSLAAGAWLFGARTVAALPGDWLYPLKTGLSAGLIGLAPTPTLRLDWEARRLATERDDALSLIRLGRPAALTFAGELAPTSDLLWLVGGVRVHLTAETRLVGRLEPGTWVRVRGRLDTDGTVTASQIQAAMWLVEGRLTGATAGGWQVALGDETLEVLLAPSSQLFAIPQVGQLVQMQLLRRADGAWQVRSLQAPPPTAPPQ